MGSTHMSACQLLGVIRPIVCDHVKDRQVFIAHCVDVALSADEHLHHPVALGKALQDGVS